MTQKVLYFQAGKIPTAPEIAEIAKIALLADPLYDLTVVNGAEAANAYGTDASGDPRLIPHDLVAGTIPTEYNASDVLDPDAQSPVIGAGADMAVVYEGQVIAGTGGTFTVTVTAGVIGGTWAAA